MKKFLTGVTILIGVIIMAMMIETIVNNNTKPQVQSCYDGISYRVEGDTEYITYVPALDTCTNYSDN